MGIGGLPMPGPLSFRQFEALVRSYGCTMEIIGRHGAIRKDGKYVSRFAITHGKRTKGNEVKDVYVRIFLRAMRGESSEQGSNT